MKYRGICVVIILLIIIVLGFTITKSNMTSSVILVEDKEEILEKEICMDNVCAKCKIICKNGELVDIDKIDEKCADFALATIEIEYAEIGNEVCE